MKSNHTRRFLFCLAVLGVFILASLKCIAQTAEGISIIAYDTKNQQIDTFSATDLDYKASLYYSPYVEGYLYQSDDWNDPIKSGSAIGDFGCSGPNDVSMTSCAWGTMSVPAVSGDAYELDSDHYVETSWTTGSYDSSGNPTYYDEYGFYGSNGSTDGSSGDGYDPSGYTLTIDTALIYLGTTVVDISTYDQTPIITSVNPDIIPDGTTSTVVVSGMNFGAAPQLQFPDAPGMTITYSSRSDTQITAQVTPNGNEGTHSVQVISNGIGGTGFLSSPSTSNSSPAQTLTVSGTSNQCTWQIETDQQLYHIAASVQDGSSNYQSASIPISAITTQNAVCPGPSQVTWTVKAVYQTSGGKGQTTTYPAGFTNNLNQTKNYATTGGTGGQLTFTAKFTTSDGKTLSASKTVFVDGTKVPSTTVNPLLDQSYAPYLPSGGTSTLFEQVACYESMGGHQFSTYHYSGTGAVPTVIYGINACWPTQSYDGGSHIGLLMVDTTMADGFDWTQNVSDAFLKHYKWALNQANTYVNNTRALFPKLPVPTGSQIEDIALTYYNAGAKDQSNTYWLGNSAGTAWAKNADTNYTEYVDHVRACH